MSTHAETITKAYDRRVRNSTDYIPAKTTGGVRQIKVSRKRPKLRSEYADFQNNDE